MTLLLGDLRALEDHNYTQRIDLDPHAELQIDPRTSSTAIVVLPARSTSVLIQCFGRFFCTLTLCLPTSLLLFLFFALPRVASVSSAAFRDSSDGAAR